MEVFVRGVPERATEYQTTNFFRPILNKLSIKHWHCQKKVWKRFATLTFLSSMDGERFLSLYNQVKNGLSYDYLPLGRMDFMFQGNELHCRLSTKPPDPFALKSLEMDAKASETRTTNSAKMHSGPTPSGEDNRSLECSSASCGLWEYIGTALVFTSYLDWKVHGNMKFGAKAAIIRMDTGQRIDIPYSTIQGITAEGLPRPAITMALTEAPHLFQSIDKGCMTPNMDGSDFFVPMEDLFSTLDINNQRGPSRERLLGLSSEHEKIAGSCLVYRIGLVNSTFDEQMSALGHARGIPPSIRRHIDIHTPKERYEVEMGKLLQTFSTSYTGLPFAVKFQVQKLAQNGYLSPNKVLALLPEISDLSSRSRVRVCVNAIRRLFQQIPFPGPEIEAREFQLEALICLLRGNEEQSKSRGIHLDELRGSEHIAVIHRATVTPAGTYLYGPEPESNNRVLRKYSKHHDYFVRVQFCDEDGMQVRYNPNVSNDLIFYRRFKKVLDEGINIGGRQFAFLGFSHSSLRAQSCWFMAPFLHNGSLLFDRMLIEGLGDFSHIRCAAKCAARIGQAFSETPTAITLAPGVAKEMKDVERNGRVFSDGVGTVSMSVLQQIWDALPEAKRKQTSVFQIRYSGTAKLIYIVLLPSQSKTSLHLNRLIA
jgi:hypothetical protein